MQDALDAAKSTLEELQTLAGSTGQELGQTYSSVFGALNTQLRQTEQYITKINTASAKFASNISSRPATSSLPFPDFSIKGLGTSQALRVASINSYSKQLMKLRDNDLALPDVIGNQLYQAMLPVVMQEIKMQRVRGTSFITNDILSSKIANHAGIKNAASTLLRRNVDTPELKRIVENIIIGSGQNIDYFSTRGQRYQGENNPVHRMVLDDLPDVFKEAYATRGYSNDKAKHMLDITGIGRRDMNRIVNIVNSSNDYSLRQMLIRRGLVQNTEGVLTPMKPTKDALNLFSADLVEYLANLRAGGETWARDFRTTLKQPKRGETVKEIMNILAKDKNLNPYKSAAYGANGTPTNNYDAPTEEYKQRHTLTRVEKWQARAKTTSALPVSYYIPQVQLADDGSLTFSDPTNAKLDFKGRKSATEARPDDPFVVIGSNQLTNLLGFRPIEDELTFGYGRDDKGRAIYNTPKIIKLNTKG